MSAPAADCPDCAGLGSKVKRINRRRDRSISSVTFSLKDDCATCGGTGKIEGGK